MRDIHIASAIIDGPDGRTLLVRKAGSAIFMQAGGKIEPGEAPLTALRRELHEELDLTVAEADATYVGRFHAVAANEPGCRVVAEIFRLRVTDSALRPNAELAELIWIDAANPPQIQIAPLSRDQILPIAAR